MSVIEAEKGDYVVVRGQGKKTVFGQVVAVSKKEYTIAIEKGRFTDNELENIEVDHDALLVNLGEEPAVGSVYGHRIEPCIHHAEIGEWGHIYIHRFMSDGEKSRLKLALKAAKKVLQDFGCWKFGTINLKISNPRGQYAGMYKVISGEQWVEFYPPSMDSETEMVHLIIHEAGHAVWFRCVPNKIKAKWVRLYHHYTSRSEVSESDLHDLRSLLDDNEVESLSQLRSLTETGEQDAVLDEVVAWINDKHSLEVEDINLLLAAGDKMEDIWPQAEELLLTDVETAVTEYGMKNVREFFAESFRVYLDNEEKLPPRIRKAMGITIQHLRQA